jgi:hypothetical protein
VTSDGFGLDRGRYSGDQVTDRSEIGAVDAAGAFADRGEVPIGWSSWSADYSHLVQETADGFWVQAVDHLDRHVTLRLPKQGLPTALPVWESEDSVLVTFLPSASWTSMLDEPSQGDFSSRETYVLRCSTTSGDCEIALEPGYGGAMRGPMYR